NLLNTSEYALPVAPEGVAEERNVRLYPSASEQTVSVPLTVRAAVAFEGVPFVGAVTLVAFRNGVETNRWTDDLTENDYGPALFDAYTSPTRGIDRIEVRAEKDGVTYRATSEITWLEPPTSSVVARLELTNPVKPGDPRVPSYWGDDRIITVTVMDAAGIPIK